MLYNIKNNCGFSCPHQINPLSLHYQTNRAGGNSINSANKIMALRSPKHKYCATITFDKYINGVGQSIIRSSDDLEALKSIMAQLREDYKVSGYVEIRENRAEYPKFDWFKIDWYKL